MQAILGRGIDNHLLGLRAIAEHGGVKTPQLFVDNAYQISNHFTLSTSQVLIAYSANDINWNEMPTICFIPRLHGRANIEQTSSKRRAKVQQTSSKPRVGSSSKHIVSLSGQLIEPGWSCKQGITRPVDYKANELAI